MGTINEKEISGFSEDLRVALKAKPYLKHDINYGDNVKVIKLPHDSKEYAVKVDDFFVENDFFSYIYELKTRKSKNIPIENFISVVEISVKEKSVFCTNRMRIYSRFEYVRSSLRTFIEKLKPDTMKTKLEESQCLYIIAVVIDTLKKLEKFNIFHGNIRPETILIDDDGMVKLTDSVFMLKESSYQSYLIGKIDKFYVCPSTLQQLKLLNTNPKINHEKNNVFCLGLSILEAMTLCDINLIFDKSDFSIIKKRLEELIRKAAKNYDKFLIDLIVQMLQLNEEKRIKYEDILDYLKNLLPDECINIKRVLLDGKKMTFNKNLTLETNFKMSHFFDSKIESASHKKFEKSKESIFFSDTKRTKHTENMNESH